MNEEDTDQMMTPFPETADIETSNDDYATRFRGAVGAWMLNVQERGVLGMLSGKVKPGAKILDIGGGHGQLAHPLVRDGYQVEVLSSAESCRHRIGGLVESGKCGFKVGNVIELPYPDKSFDAVVAVRMLTHCAQWEKLVAEMCRVSKGVVVADYPTSQSLNAGAPALFNAKKKYEKNTREWRLFQHSEVDAAFEAAGYVRTGRFVQFLLPMVVHRALKCKPLSAFMEGVFRAICFTRLWGSPVIVRMERNDPPAKQKQEDNK